MGFLATIGIGAAVIGAVKLIADGSKKAKERQAEEERRKNTPCYFDNGISQSEFTEIVYNAGRRIKRLQVLVDGPIVYGKVESQSGISTWEFKLDYNDYGRITGTYWESTENSDSSIPGRLGQLIQDEISNRLQ